VVGGHCHTPAALPPGKTRYPLYRRLGRPQGRSGRMRKISPPPGCDPRTVQPVASRYTDWAIPAPIPHNSVQFYDFNCNLFLNWIILNCFVFELWSFCSVFIFVSISMYVMFVQYCWFCNWSLQYSVDKQMKNTWTELILKSWLFRDVARSRLAVCYHNTNLPRATPQKSHEIKQTEV
jgi:hypothetical protein